MADDRRYGFRQTDRSPVFLIGILVVLIIVFGAALVWMITQTEEEEPFIPVTPNETVVPTYPNETVNETNTTEVCDDSCYYDLAVATANVSACVEILNESLQQDCYEELSDVSMAACTAVEDIQKKTECITAFAVEENDLSICNHLGENAESCQLAVDPCLLSEDMDLCEALAYDDPSECKSSSACLLNYSITKKDSESCMLVQNTVVQKACVSSVTRNDKCYELGKVAEQDYCYQLYAMYTDNYYLCSETTWNSQYAIDCYSYFAARLNDLSICDEDGFSLDTLWDCYTNYSLLSGDLAGCEGIHELATTSRFTCAFDFAKKYGDPSACLVIEELPKRTTCYEGAIIYRDTDIDWTKCENITSFEWRNKCYTESAKIYDDVSLCDYIDVGYAEEACKIAYEANKNE